MTGRFAFVVLALAAALGVSLAAQADPRVLFEAARKSEVVDGNLQAAIQQYQKVVETADRHLVAQALIRMAGCYRLLGDAQAKALYERVVREYTDQPSAVAIARANLTNVAPASRGNEMTLSKLRDVPTGNSGGGPISPDEQFMYYVDWETGDLAVHEFRSGRNRRLTNKGSWEQSPEYAEMMAVSRDGRQLAYSWFNGTRYQVRLTETAPSARVSSPRTLFPGDDLVWIAPYDWSPDGKRIAVVFARTGAADASIGWLTVDSGALHTVTSGRGRGSQGGTVTFSPDGKQLAFDLPGDDTVMQRDLVIIDSGERAIPVRFANPGRDELVGWSPDGRWLIFLNEQSGIQGLWAIAVDGGRPHGQPLRVKPDLGQVSPLGLSAAGRLYFASRFEGQSVYVAHVDFALATRTAPAVRMAQNLANNRWADWSPDGSLIVYKSERPRGFTLAIHADATGELVRELKPDLADLQAGLEWTPDGRSILARGADRSGRRGIFRIDAQTADVTLVRGGTFASGPASSPRGDTLYYTRALSDRQVALIAFDLSAGNERELLRRPQFGAALSISPDGRSLALSSSDPSDKSSTIILVDTERGTARELLRTAAPQSFSGVTWNADGSTLIARRALGESLSAFEVLLIPAAGGPPRPLDLGVPNVTPTPIRAHPDGRRIAVGSGSGPRGFREVWVLENFLPTSR
jgi:Tol biopolymer transport system component